MIYPMPPSFQFNGQTGHDQLLGLPPPYVICGLYGWLLGLTIPMNSPYSSASYVTWDPTLIVTYPSLEWKDQTDHQGKLLNWSVSLIQIRELGKLSPLQVLVVNYPSVTSYTRKSELPSQTRHISWLTTKHSINVFPTQLILVKGSSLVWKSKGWNDF
jgi:hypothetical protein